MCEAALKKLESIPALRFVVNFMHEHCEEQNFVLNNKARIGVEILKQLDHQDRTHYIHLIKEPLLMLEQLLMNCKFENLRKILKVLHKSDDLNKAELSVESFDKLIRFYAGKSLDFRVSLQNNQVDGKLKDSKDFFTVSESRSGDFIMPAVAPTKQEWIPNEKVFLFYNLHQ